MAEGSRKRILFSGAAPIHFICCLPVYERLAADPRVEFWLTGGFRTGKGDDARYSLDGFFTPFPVDKSRVIPVERAAAEDFDVLLAAHLSPALPRFAKRSVQVFHGVSFKNLLVREKYLAFNYLCLAGRYHAEVYRRMGYVRPGGAQCLITGFPKVDALVSGALDRNAILRAAGADPGRPTILYAPTGSLYNSMETMGLDVIRAIAAANRWNLLVKLHDHPKKTDVDWTAAIAPLEGPNVRLVKGLDVVPYLFAAELVLTDASSVSVEYTLLDRPIVFLDVPQLLDDVRERGGPLDMDTHGRKMGTIVKGPAEVVGAIGDALAHPERDRDRRQATARHVFHDPGRATARVTGVVLHAAGLADGLPAGVEVLAPESGAAAATGT